MVRERTHEATRHAEHLRSAVDGAVQRARDSRSSEVRLHRPALPCSCQCHTHTQPDLIPPDLIPPDLAPPHSDLASATCQVPRSTEARCSSKANSPVVMISRHQIKMSKKRKELDWRAGVNARRRAANAVAATPSPPPSTSSPRTTSGPTSGGVPFRIIKRFFRAVFCGIPSSIVVAPTWEPSKLCVIG